MWRQIQISLHYQCVDTAKITHASSSLPLTHEQNCHVSIFVLLNATLMDNHKHFVLGQNLKFITDHVNLVL